MSCAEVCTCRKLHSAKSEKNDARSLRYLRVPTGKRREQKRDTAPSNSLSVPLICDDCVTLRLIDVSTLYLLDRAERYKKNDVQNMPFEFGITPVHDTTDACVADAVFSEVQRYNAKEEQFGVNLAKQTIAHFVCESQREASALEIVTPVDTKLPCDGSESCLDENFVNVLQNQLTLGCETRETSAYRTNMRTFTYSKWFTAEAFKWRSEQDDAVVTLDEIVEMSPNMPFTCALTLLHTTATQARCMARIIVRDNSVRSVREKQKKGEMAHDMAETLLKRLLDDNRNDAAQKDSPSIGSMFFAPVPPVDSALLAKQAFGNEIDLGSAPSVAAVMSFVDENSHRLQRLMRRWRSLVLKYVPHLHTAVVAASNPENDVECMAARCDLLSRELNLDEFVAETERFYNEVRISESYCCAVPFLFDAGPKEINDPREIFKYTAAEVYNYCAQPLSSDDDDDDDDDESYDYDDAPRSIDDGFLQQHSRCNSQCSCGDDSSVLDSGEHRDNLSPEDDWMYSGARLHKRQQKRNARALKRALERESRARAAQLKAHPDNAVLDTLPEHVRALLTAKNCELDHMRYEQDVLVEALRKLTQLLDFLHLECVVTAAEAHHVICQTQPFALGNGATARAVVNCVLGTCQLPPLFLDKDSAEMETYKNVTAFSMQHASPLTFAAYLAEYVRDEIRFNESSRTSHFFTTCNTLGNRRAQRTLLCGDEGSVFDEFSVACRLWKHCRKRSGHDTSNAKHVSWGCDVSTIALERSALASMMRKLCENEQRANADFQMDYYSASDDDHSDVEEADADLRLRLLRAASQTYKMLNKK